MFEKLNMKNTVREGIDLNELEFTALKDYIGQVVVVDGFRFNDKGRFGRQVMVVGHVEGSDVISIINMPSRFVEQFEEIYSDDMLLAGVLKGKLKLVEIEEMETRNGTTTNCRFMG